MTHSDENSQIQELISCYIDGQLTSRQETELKRLIQHDAHIARQLNILRRQKQLLGNLPRQAAPPELLQAIQNRLERRQLLGPCGLASRPAGGRMQLFMRRVLTVAAMVVLPVAILSVVMFYILSPSQQTTHPGDTASVDNKTTGVDTSAGKAVTATGTYDILAGLSNRSMKLSFSTDDPQGVSDFIEKAIYTCNLLEDTKQDSDPSGGSYNIACSQADMARLVSELASVWGKCVSVSFEVAASDVEDAVVVENIQPVQLLSLCRAMPAELLALAGEFARLNTQKSGLASPAVPDDMAIPPKPIQTGGGTEKTADTRETSTSPNKISLIINVKSL